MLFGVVVGGTRSVLFGFLGIDSILWVWIPASQSDGVQDIFSAASKGVVFTLLGLSLGAKSGREICFFLQPKTWLDVMFWFIPLKGYSNLILSYKCTIIRNQQKHPMNPQTSRTRNPKLIDRRFLRIGALSILTSHV